MVSYIVISLVGLLLVALDQITKMAVVSNITYRTEEIVVIENFFDIVHWRNTGAAWGVFSDKTWLLTIFSLACVLVVLLAYGFAKSKLLKLSLMLIAAGAIGNIIDRIRLGYVIDFLSFDNLFGYQFPAFNVADICVVAGAIGIVIFVLFIAMPGKSSAFREGTFLWKFFDSDPNVAKKQSLSESESGDKE